MDPATIKFRVRINHLTDIHAVAERKNGTLIQTARFVKASGGCSAPMSVTVEEAKRGMGEIKLQVAGEISGYKPVDATAMVHFLNFNGMQMNEPLQVYTRACYILRSP